MIFADEKSVLAYLDLGYVLDRFQQGEDGDLEFDLRELAERERHESRITDRSRSRAFHCNSEQRLHWMNVPDAAAKLPVFMKRHKYSVRLHQHAPRNIGQRLWLSQQPATYSH